jgi:hypothetical protein
MTILRKIEWEAIGGLIAAIAAITLHFLHVTDANVLHVITLALVSLLFLRDLRGEGRWESIGTATQESVRLLQEVRAGIHPPEIDLIGPARLRCVTAQFAARAQGEVVWFNACSHMLDTKDLLDAIVQPFLVNPRVTTLRFVLEPGERGHWETKVQPAVDGYPGCGKLDPPCWAPLDSGISFVIAETDSLTGKAEALVSFWGEPFMAVHHDRRMPGYILHVHDHSELIGRLREVERASRAASHEERGERVGSS